MKIDEDKKITVCIRKRPLFAKEKSRKEQDIIKVNGERLVLEEEREKVDLTKYIEYHKYRFDKVFSEKTDNREVNLIDLQQSFEESSERISQWTQGHLFRIRTDRQRKDIHYDWLKQYKGTISTSFRRSFQAENN